MSNQQEKVSLIQPTLAKDLKARPKTIFNLPEDEEQEIQKFNKQVKIDSTSFKYHEFIPE